MDNDQLNAVLMRARRRMNSVRIVGAVVLVGVLGAVLLIRQGSQTAAYWLLGTLGTVAIVLAIFVGVPAQITAFRVRRELRQQGEV